MDFRLNSKNGGLKTPSKYGTMGRKQGKVTDGCKKTPKFVQDAFQSPLKRLDLEEVFNDINAIIVTRNFNSKDVTSNSKKLFLTSTYTRDKH